MIFGLHCQLNTKRCNSLRKFGFVIKRFDKVVFLRALLKRDCFAGTVRRIVGCRMSRAQKREFGCVRGIRKHETQENTCRVRSEHSRELACTFATCRFGYRTSEFKYVGVVIINVSLIVFSLESVNWISEKCQQYKSRKLCSFDTSIQFTFVSLETFVFTHYCFAILSAIN